MCKCVEYGIDSRVKRADLEDGMHGGLALMKEVTAGTPKPEPTNLWQCFLETGYLLSRVTWSL